MANIFKTYPAALVGADAVLRPAFDELVRVALVTKEDGEDYSVTDLGRDVVLRFLERQEDARMSFSVYSSIDLKTGEFFWDTPKTVDDHPQDPRWTDLRLTVAEFKGMNLRECAFLFSCAECPIFPALDRGWQDDLMTGPIVESWSQQGPSVKYLNFKDDKGTIPGAEVIELITSTGARLNKTHYRSDDAGAEDDAWQKQFGVIAALRVSTKTVRNYLKPSYVAPCWRQDILTGKRVRKAPEYYWK